MHTDSQLSELFNAHLLSLSYSHHPDTLFEPIRYVLSLGGKRIRPLLMLMTYEMFKDNAQSILDQAAGVEIYHNFTLLHDDLMDKADKRRGHLTVHIKWDENTAVLSGDAMTVLAYEYLAKCDKQYLPQILDIFNRTALEICEGQQLDMDFESRNNVTEDEYIEMIRLKTAVLLAGSLRIGATLAGADEADAQQLYDFGIQIGLAFQLQDDLLDVYGDTVSFGKNIGGDILCNKKTYMLIKTLELANEEQRANLEKWLQATDFDPKEKIAAVTEIYNELHISDYCNAKIQDYYIRGIASLQSISVDTIHKTTLTDYANKMMHRAV